MASADFSSVPPLPYRGHARSSSFSHPHSSTQNLTVTDQIQQLELEGTLLRSQVDDILRDVSSSGRNDYDSYQDRSRTLTSERSRTPVHHRSSSLDAILGPDSRPRRSDSRNYLDVADSRSEQQTLDNITSKLDAQQAAVASLQNRLRSSHAMSPSSGRYGTASFPSRTEVFLPPSSVERELRDTREQLEYFKNQLRISHEKATRDKIEYKNQVDNLRARLFEAQAVRDNLTQLRSKESESQEELVARLQYSLQNLQEANRQQEEALIETNKQLDSAQKNHYLADNVTNELRSILTDIETRRGRPFYANDPAAHQPVGMLIETLDRCLQEYTADIENRIQDIYALEKEISDVRQICLKEKDDVETAWREKLISVKENYENQLQQSREKAVDARQRIESLDGQLKLANDQLQYHTESKVDRIKELEEKLARMREDYDKDRRAWNNKRDALESGIDEVQKEAITFKTERDEAVRKITILETKSGTNDSELSDLKDEHEDLQKKYEEAVDEQDNLRQSIEDLKEDVNAKLVEITDLRRLINTISQEASEMTREEIHRVLAEEKEFSATQISNLTTKLKNMNKENENLNKEFQNVKTELDFLQDSFGTLSEDRKDLEKQVKCYQEDQKQLQQLISNRDIELERLTKERDYYYNNFNEKTEDIAAIKADYQHLVRILEDKSNELTTFETDFASRAEKMSEELSAKQWALQEIREGREAIIHKLRLRDKKLHDTLIERDNLKAEVNSKLIEIEKLENERDSLYLELKDSRFELAGNKEELGATVVALKREKETLQRKVSDLTSKVSDMKCELSLAKDTLKVKESTERRTVKVAGKMQKTATVKRNQLDLANKQIKTLQDHIDDLGKRNILQTEELEKSNSLLKKMRDQNERLAGELDHHVRKNKESRNCIEQLETANAKLMAKLSLCQKHIEELEQKVLKMEMKASLKVNGKVELNKDSGVSSNEIKDSLSEIQRLIRSNKVYQSPKTNSSENLYLVRNKSRPSSASAVIMTRHRRPSDSGTCMSEPDKNTSQTDYRPTSLRSSPVEDLLTSRSESEADPISAVLSSTSKRLLRQQGNYNKPSTSPHNHKQVEFTEDPDVVCQRLQDKIQKLVLMGTNMRKENQETANMVADQRRYTKRSNEKFV